MSKVCTCCQKPLTKQQNKFCSRRCWGQTQNDNRVSIHRIFRNMILCNMYESGSSLREISKKTGIPISTIRYPLMRAGILRSVKQSLRLASEQGRLGAHFRGKPRVFTEEHRASVIKAAKARRGTGVGWTTKQTGYVEATMGPNKFRSQHRIIMEQHLGRPLGREEVVHHINGMRNDNRIENLEVMSASEHARHHALENVSKRQRTKLGRFV